MPCLRMPRFRERPPGESWDSRSASSVYWGKTCAKVKMCPHVKPGGGQCGLTAEFCMCMCLLCGAPMRARKRCGAWSSSGDRCPWGQDRSPEVSSPEQSPPNIAIPRKRRWYLGPAATPPPGPAPSVPPSHATVYNSPLINFVTVEPGGRDPPMPPAPKRGRPPKPRPADPSLSFPSTPTSSPPPPTAAANDIPHPRPPTVWNTNKPASLSVPPNRKE